MYAPHSVHRDGWSSLKWFGNPIFSKDFVHDHSVTWKVHSTSTQKASFKFKEELDVRRDGHLDTRDELKVWFPVGDQYLYGRIGNDAVKLHYDHGTTTIKGRNFNFYGSLDFHKNWSRNAVKVGVQSLSEKCNSDNRIKVDEEYVATWGHRTKLTLGNWKVGLLAVVNLNEHKLIKKDFVVGWKKNEWEVLLEGDQDWKRPTDDWKDITRWFTRLSLTGLYHRSKRETYGVEVDVNTYSKAINTVTGLVEFHQNDRNSLKLKFNHKLNLAFALRRRITDQLTASLGATLPISSEAKSHTKVGLQLDLNV